MGDWLLASIVLVVSVLTGILLVMFLMRKKRRMASDEIEYDTIFSAGFGVFKALSLFALVAFFTIALWFVIFSLPADFPIPLGIIFFSVLLIPVILLCMYIEKKRRERTPITLVCYVVFRL